MRYIQSTISGKDAGGYIWENVLHFSTTDDTSVDADVLDSLNGLLFSQLNTPLINAMNESTFILNLASKFIYLVTSFTLNLPTFSVGVQVGDPSVGALCGKISFYPDSGAASGRMFVAGPVDGDFGNDLCTADYIVLLQAIADALIAINGTIGIYEFQFGLWTKKTHVFTPFTHSAAMQSPGVLSKRIRV